MRTCLVKSSDVNNGKIPKRATFVKASNDGINWEPKYYVQLETDSDKPFVCVDMERDIHFPASRGKKFSMMRHDVYEVDDIILFDKKFLTRDKLYETIMEPNSRNHYWDRTAYAKTIGTNFLFTNKLRDIIDVSQLGAEKAVEILNNLL